MADEYDFLLPLIRRFFVCVWSTVRLEQVARGVF